MGVWRGQRASLSAAFDVLLAPMFVPVWFNSWFVIWPLAVAALLPNGTGVARKPSAEKEVVDAATA